MFWGLKPEKLKQIQKGFRHVYNRSLGEGLNVEEFRQLRGKVAWTANFMVNANLEEVWVVSSYHSPLPVVAGSRRMK